MIRNNYKRIVKEENKGITLIALVITIIVLLILAGVTVAMLTGENGILNKANEAKIKTQQAEIEEREKLAYTEAKLVEGQYVSEKGVNSPILGDAMTPVDSEGNPIQNYNEWYDYKDQGADGIDGKTSKWANAKSKDGSMWVWIPRYAYSITNGYHCNGIDKTNLATSAGTIKVVFLQGTSDVPSNNTKIERIPTLNNNDATLANAMTNYVVHPVFTSNIENGGWSEELPGFWVAKYEASKENSTDTIEGTNNIIKIQNNTITWRSITENEVFNNCKNMNMQSNPYGFSSSNTPHQIKNSEWGAVAYLAHSQYGRNGNKVEQNNVSINTGLGGENTSTTGNNTGIYGMNGGTDEMLATHFKDSSTEYMNDLVNSTDLKLKNVYTSSNNEKFGDGIFETSYDNSKFNSWFGGFILFIYKEHPLIARGGHYQSINNESETFSYFLFNGSRNDLCGFRPTVVM